MTGRCRHCRAKTMALPGAQEQFSRALPPAGFRLGWVQEWATSNALICHRCVAERLNRHLTIRRIT
jgi:hypothetical protein